MLMARFGWRPFFFVLGAASLAWLIPWLKWMPRGKGIALARVEDSPSVLQILKERSALGSCRGLFCGNYFWYFLLTWLPSYMVMERHFSMNRYGYLWWCWFISRLVSQVVMAFDRWIAAGGTPTRVRKTFTVGGLALSSVVILPVVTVQDKDLSMALLFLACIFFGMWSSNHWAVIQTLAGPPAAGKWTALQNGVGNLAGVAAPALTGFIVKRTHEFFWAFAISTVIVLAGVVYLPRSGRIVQVTGKSRRQCKPRSRRWPYRSRRSR